VIAKITHITNTLIQVTKAFFVGLPAKVWFAIGVIVVAATGYFFFLDQVIRTFGWSFLPIGLWLSSALFLIVFNRAILSSNWRWALSSLALVLSISGALGIFYTPLDSLSKTYGGGVGAFIARYPIEWDRFDVGMEKYILAWSRIIFFALVAFSLAAPDWAKKILGSVWTLLIMGYTGILNGFKIIYQKYTNWRIQRAEIQRLRQEDRDAYEADLALRAKEQTLPHTVPSDNNQEPPETVKNPTKTDNHPRPSATPEEAELEGRSLSERDTSTLEDDPETPITVAFPTKAEVEEAEEHGIMVPDYSAAQKFQWPLPDRDILKIARPGGITQEEITDTSRRVEASLEQFGIDVSVDQVRQGPTVTMYGLSPGWKGRSEQKSGQRVRVDTILNREKDIALALASPNLRFEAPVPGESVVGIEVPNTNPTEVTLRSVMDSKDWTKFVQDAALPVPLGLGSGGEAVMADLSRMPHTLVAGSTGSGKSVCMNAIITGLIMTKTPLELRLIMIDPKRVELTPYQDIPHLYHPVIVEADRAVVVLRSLVDEMMGRFRQLEQAGVKNIASYNEKQEQKMPYLVILVDELADLMLTAAGDVERLLVRLAQLGRATGVHLVVATQRPSVDVVTGLIKANFPSRISFAVMSQIDSRTILDSVGAEKLLGRGDMLYMPIDKPKPSRVQGAFLKDQEIEGVVSSWKNTGGPSLPELVVSFDDAGADNNGTGASNANSDSLFEQAAGLAQSQKTLSVSLLQRRLRIGYPRAARLMDELEDRGIVGSGEPGKPRPVL
tara:strand:- start:3008 stop:5353 length:2346 start_codon:yes stop_codon:yes gene_type:complete